jgi:FixJ family two-component response regulator
MDYLPLVKKILNVPLVSVVDDDKSVREALASFLMSFGFEVESFSSAEEFLNSIYLYGTDYLILDIKMEGMNGLELQRQLAAAHHQIPIIFATAHGSRELREQAIRAGAVAFLPKPFNAGALLRAVGVSLDA